MAGYTPTTKEVRKGYASCAGFDRWLAKYVQQVLRDAPTGPCNHERAAERLAHTTALDRDSARALLDGMAAMSEPAPTLATEAAHAVSVSAADVQQALDDLDEIAPVGHTVYVSTADAPEECTDECPGCMTDRIRAVLTATLRITVTDGGEGRG